VRRYDELLDQDHAANLAKVLRELDVLLINDGEHACSPARPMR